MSVLCLMARSKALKIENSLQLLTEYKKTGIEIVE